MNNVKIRKRAWSDNLSSFVDLQKKEKTHSNSYNWFDHIPLTGNDDETMNLNAEIRRIILKIRKLKKKRI